MTSEQRARIQAEIDVLVGSCPPGDVDARAAMYIEQDALVDQGVYDPIAAGDGEWAMFPP